MTVQAGFRSPSLTRARDEFALTPSAYAVSLGLAAVSSIAAGCSLLFPGLLDGVPVTDGNLRGTALLVVLVAVPLLLTGMSLTVRGSLRGLVAWLGAAGYLTYQV
jgi:hypothetical protein